MSDGLRTIRPVTNHPNFRYADIEDLVAGAELYTVTHVATDDGNVPYPDQLVQLDNIPINGSKGQEYVFFHYVLPEDMDLEGGVHDAAPLTEFLGATDPNEFGQDNTPQFWIKIKP